MYSTTFRKYEKFCTRLHFFKSKIDNLNRIKNGQIEEQDYLGFTVVRPLEVGKIGRTILQPIDSYPDSYYPLCLGKFKTHLFGREFEVMGSPYIQQDSMVMVCAQASIWMAARYMHVAEGFPRHLPSEITESAGKGFAGFGRVLPAEALNYFQMVSALDHMGYSPILFLKPEEKGRRKKKEKPWNPIEYVYSYVESKIPVIIGVPEHVVTIVGHTFTPHPQTLQSRIGELIQKYDEHEREKRPPPKAVVSSKEWANGFIINDDSQGPYRLLPCNKNNQKEFRKSDLKDLLPSIKGTYETLNDVDSIIIPLPKKVYLLGGHAEKIAKDIIEDESMETWLRLLGGAGNKEAKEILKCFNPHAKNPVVLRTYIVSSTKYKELIQDKHDQDDRNEGKMDKLVLETYERLKMPRYIWISEITTATYLSKNKEKDRRILGEIILDATAHKFSPISYIAIHIPGIIFVGDHQTGKPDFILIPNDHPYRHHSRRL